MLSGSKNTSKVNNYSLLEKKSACFYFRKQFVGKTDTRYMPPEKILGNKYNTYELYNTIGIIIRLVL